MKRLGDKCYCKDKVSSPITKYTELEPALCQELKKIVEAVVVPGKGLLACDESPASLQKRFDELGVENTETNRRNYRQMLFSADKSEFSKCISGVILHHETVYEKTTDGIDMIELLRQRNVVPGIKVDKGLVPLFGAKNENTTEGLDNLQERCIQYKRDGCHFAKWRCTFSITETTPSQLAMVTNADVLARYATICQSARIVPIIEPEILSPGDHGINKALEVHEEVLSNVMRALHQHRVYLEGMILKSAMVLSGRKEEVNCTPQIVAEHTVLALQRTIPPAVPAVLFLSGGQTDEDSVINLNAIVNYEGKKPWQLTYCYGRALQNEVMKIWKGNSAKVAEAQTLLLKKIKLASQAALGQLEVENSVCTK
ncbi:fructose-bisphosphate aldolase [Apis mellifera caucasica]|uniref:Fructose-bisphosphate aldolase n=1 Tax=Apis mellifera TaxID=7460 RepID=A0A7M7MTN4_APIME|nr:fructose-bisphosphate aldolase [Apis mellifera]KAG6804106.1 fructose-bisphosphate aldolase [Apis mellifera caucasica]|eukprot:XP_026300714.1 fructose-bisphosphate aldolase [Apis mellifera]